MMPNVHEHCFAGNCTVTRTLSILAILLLSSGGGCWEEKPPPPTFGVPAAADPEVKSLTLNGVSAQAKPLTFESKQPLKFDAVLVLPDGWEQPYVGLVHAIKYLDNGSELSASSGKLTLDHEQDGSLRLTAELPAPVSPGTYELRAGLQINREFVSVTRTTIEVAASEE